MNLAKKVCMIIIACLLVLGVVCLACGILLGGSFTEVITAAGAKLSGFLGIFFRTGTP